MNTFAPAALLTLALATTGVASEASAQSPVAHWLSYMPVNGGVQWFDANRDSWVDVILYDTNRDGLVEAARVAGNLDGYLNAVALDTDRNGVWNEFIFDTNRDGVLDQATVDSNGDGHMDMVGYDPNRTGYFSGWTSLSPPASSGQHGAGGVTISSGYWPPGFGTGAQYLMVRLPPGTGGSSVPPPGTTSFDPVAPSDYCTYTDTYRIQRYRC